MKTITFRLGISNMNHLKEYRKKTAKRSLAGYSPSFIFIYLIYLVLVKRHYFRGTVKLNLFKNPKDITKNLTF